MNTLLINQSQLRREIDLDTTELDTVRSEYETAALDHIPRHVHNMKQSQDLEWSLRRSHVWVEAYEVIHHFGILSRMPADWHVSTTDDHMRSAIVEYAEKNGIRIVRRSQTMVVETVVDEDGFDECITIETIPTVSTKAPVDLIMDNDDAMTGLDNLKLGGQLVIRYRSIHDIRTQRLVSWYSNMFVKACIARPSVADGCDPSVYLVCKGFRGQSSGGVLTAYSSVSRLSETIRDVRISAYKAQTLLLGDKNMKYHPDGSIMRRRWRSVHGL